MPLITRIQALMAVAMFAAMLGCNPTGHFVPGESPTVTPRYNAEGTPSAPIVITEDLPAGWRWQYSREFPVAGKDSWALLGAESEVMGFILHDGGDCWVLIGQNVPDQSCHSRNEIGRFAVEILVVKAHNMPTPAASSASTGAQQESPLGAFKTAFEPENASEEHQVRQLNEGTLTWTASVYGSGLYQLIECPPGEAAPPDGGCVRGELTNTTQYVMADVQIVCEGYSGGKTTPIQPSDTVPSGGSVSWHWVHAPVAEPYSCTITWATAQ